MGLVRESILPFENKPKTFNQIFNIKNKWVPVSQSNKEKLADEFMELVDIAYFDMGGHLKVKSAKDLIRSDWDVWYANDIDEDPHADVVFFERTNNEYRNQKNHCYWDHWGNFFGWQCAFSCKLAD